MALYPLPILVIYLTTLMIANKPEHTVSVSAAPLCTHQIVGSVHSSELLEISTFLCCQYTGRASRYSDLEGWYHLVRVNYCVLV